MARPAQRPMCALFWRPALILKVAAVILGLNVPGAHGQAGPPMRPEFEVASVKPHSSSGGSLNSIARDPGLLTYTGMTVRGLIREAYGLIKVYPLSLGPDALSTDRYDVVAKVSPAASKEQRMLMLQALLAERFKLVVHRETKELPIYALLHPEALAAVAYGRVNAAECSFVAEAERPAIFKPRGQKSR